METPGLFIRVTSSLISVENESGLLLALAILKDSTLIAEWLMLDGLSGILTVEKESLLSKSPTWNFSFLILNFRPKKLASCLSVLSLPSSSSSGQILQ